jgi:hypothetical protein
MGSFLLQAKHFFSLFVCFGLFAVDIRMLFLDVFFERGFFGWGGVLIGGWMIMSLVMGLSICIWIDLVRPEDALDTIRELFRSSDTRSADEIEVFLVWNLMVVVVVGLESESMHSSTVSGSDSSKMSGFSSNKVRIRMAVSRSSSQSKPSRIFMSSSESLGLTFTVD